MQGAFRGGIGGLGMVDIVHSPVGAGEATPKKQLLAEGVFRLVGERIVSGELPPGARIRDAELASELAISRTPVREALQRLERIGMVTMYPSRYTEVTVLTPEQIEHARQFAGLQAGFTVRLACAQLTAEDVAEASRLLARVAATVDDSAACSLARTELIAFLGERCENPLQHMLVAEAAPALRRALQGFIITPEHRPRLIEACDAMERALRAGDADAAELACRAIYDLA